MNRTSARWERFRRDLRRRQIAAWVSVAAYPVTVIAAAFGLAAAVSVGSVQDGTLCRVVSDLTTVIVIVWLGIVLALPRWRYRYDRTRWYEITTNLVDAFDRHDEGGGTFYFDRTKTIVDALAQAGDGSHGEIVAGVIAEMHRGATFTKSLQTAGCPLEICTLVTDATSNRDLYERLLKLLTSYREERFRCIEQRRRFLQPVSVAAAGAVVLWIAVRVVIPVFTERFYRWSGAF